MLTRLMTTPQRTYASARERIDRILEDAKTVEAGYAALPPELRVIWQLSELLSHGTSGGAHRYCQSWNTGPLDGPMLLARIAEKIRTHDNGVAELLRWVAARGAKYRRDGGNEPFSSPVNDVIEKYYDPYRFALFAIAESWPDNLEAESLPEPPAFNPAWGEAEVAEVEAERAKPPPPHPLEPVLGEALSPTGGIVYLAEARRAELEPIFATCAFRPASDRASFRAALRTDPDGVYSNASDVTPEMVELVANAVQTGIVVVLFGSNPEAERAFAQLEPPFSVSVFDRR